MYSVPKNDDELRLNIEAALRMDTVAYGGYKYEEKSRIVSWASLGQVKNSFSYFCTILSVF